MPPPTRENRRGSGGRHGEEEFVLYLQGIPPHCRWQELKDYIRQSAHHIRQAVVYDDAHGCPTGLGQIIVKNADEAWRRLSTEGWDGQPLTVTLARALSPTVPIAGPTSSPPRMLQAMSVRPHTAFMQGSGPSDPVTPVASYPPPHESLPVMGYNRPGATTMEIHAWEAIPWMPNVTDATAAYMGAAPVVYLPYFDPTYFPSYPYQLPMFPPFPQDMHKAGLFRPYPPSYPMNESAAFQFSDWYMPQPSPQPSHGRNSVTVTIHSNPDSSPVTASVLENHFRAAGTLLHCDVYNQPDQSPRTTNTSAPHNTASEPVTATVTFQTEDEARRAVQLFDGNTLLNSRLTVRLADSSSYPYHAAPQQKFHPQRHHRPSDGAYSSSSSSSPLSSQSATRSSSASPNPPADRIDDNSAGGGERENKQQQRPSQRNGQPLVVNGSVTRRRETSTSSGSVVG